MTLTIEQVMADAKKLVDRLAEHDGAADALIAQSETLNKRIDAMKQVSVGGNFSVICLLHLTTQ